MGLDERQLPLVRCALLGRRSVTSSIMVKLCWRRVCRGGVTEAGGRAGRMEGHGKAYDYEGKTATQVCIGRCDGVQDVRTQTEREQEPREGACVTVSVTD